MTVHENCCLPMVLGMLKIYSQIDGTRLFVTTRRRNPLLDFSDLTEMHVVKNCNESLLQSEGLAYWFRFQFRFFLQCLSVFLGVGSGNLFPIQVMENGVEIDIFFSLICEIL